MRGISKKALIYIYIGALALLSPTIVESRDDFRSRRSSGSESSCCRKLNKKLCCIKKKLDQLLNKPDCNGAIAFGSNEINQPGGFVITQPGVYCLKESVVFNPTMSSFAPPSQEAVQAAITVMSSDVIIQLGSHTLSQAGEGTSTQVPYCIGILVPDVIPNSTNTSALAPGGLQSIYITGDQAIIEGFSMYGMRIFAHTYDIRLSNITVKNTAALASLALRPIVYGFPYLPHDQGTVGFGPSFGVAGIALGESTAFGMGPLFFVDVPTNVPNNVNRMSEIVLENISCLNNFNFGMFCPIVSDMTIDKCVFNDTYSDDPGIAAPGTPTNPPHHVVNAWGVAFVESSLVANDNNGLDNPNGINIFITNSTFNNTTFRGNGSSSISFTSPMVSALVPIGGLYLDRMRNVTVTDSDVNETTNLFSGSGTTFGLVTSSAQNCTFTNCHFDGIRALGTIEGADVTGGSFDSPGLSCVGIHFINCSSSNHTMIADQLLPAPVLTARSVIGFNVDNGRNLLFDGCISENLINQQFASISTSNAGFSISPLANEPNNIVLRNCVTSRNLTMNGGTTVGYSTTVASLNGLTSVVFENCIASANEVIFPPTFTPYSPTVNYAIGAVVSFVFVPNTVPVNYVALAPNGPSSTVVTPGTNPAVWGVAQGSAVSVWDPTISYVPGNIVSYEGINYLCTLEYYSRNPSFPIDGTMAADNHQPCTEWLEFDSNL